jgi:hypothetical protein
MENRSKETKTSIVGDATKGVHDAWQFFFPPTLRLAICLGITAYLGGGPFLKELLGLYPHTLASWNNHDIAATLDQYKLTPLIPVVALFVLAAIAYICNQLVFVTASLLPLGLSYSSSQLAADWSRVWFFYPEIESFDLLVTVMDFEIQKAQAEGKSELVSGVQNWESESNKQYQHFAFCKFLILWTIGWMIVIHNCSAPHHWALLRGTLVLLILVVSGAIFFLRNLYAKQQSFSAKVRVMYLLAALNGRNEISQDHPKWKKITDVITQMRKGDHGWWWFTFLPPIRFISMIEDFDVRNFVNDIYFLRKRRKPQKL